MVWGDKKFIYFESLGSFWSRQLIPFNCSQIFEENFKQHQKNEQDQRIEDLRRLKTEATKDQVQYRDGLK